MVAVAVTSFLAGLTVIRSPSTRIPELPPGHVAFLWKVSSATGMVRGGRICQRRTML